MNRNSSHRAGKGERERGEKSPHLKMYEMYRAARQIVLQAGLTLLIITRPLLGVTKSEGWGTQIPIPEITDCYSALLNCCQQEQSIQS